MPDYLTMLHHLAVPDHPNKALEEKGALGDIPEEPPIPERVPDEVKEKLLEPEVPKSRVSENEVEEEEEAPGSGRGRGQRP